MGNLHRVTLAVLATLALEACMFGNLAPTERLSDAVNGLNDEARWGRVDLAANRVDPGFRDRFNDGRTRWGTEFQIADQEIARMQILEGGDTAVSLVRVSWYRLSDMDVRLSVIEQSWRRSGQTFLLSRERVVSGDDRILAAPRPATHAPAVPSGGENPVHTGPAPRAELSPADGAARDDNGPIAMGSATR